MANYTNVTVMARKNEKRIKELLEERNDSIEIVSEAGKLYIRSRGHNILKDLEDISREFGYIINTAHSFESEQYSYSHILRYVSGEVILDDLKPLYMTTYIEPPEGYTEQDIENIREIMIAKLSKYDTVEKTATGFVVNLNSDDVFIYEYQKDMRYKFVGEKRGNLINFKIYEYKLHENNFYWQETEPVSMMKIPF